MNSSQVRGHRLFCTVHQGRMLPHFSALVAASFKYRVLLFGPHHLHNKTIHIYFLWRVQHESSQSGEKHPAFKEIAWLPLIPQPSSVENVLAALMMNYSTSLTLPSYFSPFFFHPLAETFGLTLLSEGGGRESFDFICVGGGGAGGGGALFLLEVDWSRRLLMLLLLLRDILKGIPKISII